MKLKKIKAWKAINSAGEIITTTSNKQAKKFAGEWGLVKETFVHGAA